MVLSDNWYGDTGILTCFVQIEFVLYGRCLLSTARLLSTVNLVSGLGEYKDKYKDARTTVTYEVNGDNWKIKYVTSLYPDKPMEYDVTAGKEFDGKGPDGSDVKVI